MKPLHQKTWLFLLLITAFFPLMSTGQNKDEAAVRQILSTQTKTWNKGNINEFMQGYWHSDSLSFIGKNGVKYGYETMLKNYQKNYPDTAAMGKLDFKLLQFLRLSPDYYYVIGKWHLQRSIGDLQGHFTLLFRKIKNSWVIVSDHSS